MDNTASIFYSRHAFKINIFTLALVASVTVSVSASSNHGAYREPNYYWRNYKGIIPKDAIEGGLNTRRNVTYIGQVVNVQDPGVIPGYIEPGNPEAIANNNGRFTFDIYVTILCSKQKPKFVWIPTTTDTMPQLLTDYHLVTGGTEDGSVLYIGRAYESNELQVGKVYPKGSQNPGLDLFVIGGATDIKSSFEILAYPLKKI